LPVHPEMPGVGQAHEKAHDEAHDGAHDEPLTQTSKQILVSLASGPRSRAELIESLGIKSSRSGHFLRAVEQIRRLGLVELTIPDKPQSKNQKMRITETGRAWLAARGGQEVKGK